MNCYNSCKKPEHFSNLWDPTQYEQHHNFQQQQHADYSTNIPIIDDSTIIEQLGTTYLPLEEFETNTTNNYFTFNNNNNNNINIQSTHLNHLEHDHLVNSDYKSNNVRSVINNHDHIYSVQPNGNLDEQTNYYSMINHQYNSQANVDQINNHDLRSNNENNIPKTSVELLNHFITNHSSLNSTYEGKQEKIDRNEFNQENSGSKRKLSKNKLNPKKKCSICGNESSGYHYGSHTCEACKLFFRRAEKSIRKTGFTECIKKNCYITSENRANCSQCRYKKCIAAGMSMTRSRYGRHTERISSNYVHNISESLFSLIEELKISVKLKNIDFNNLNDLIVNFYLKSKQILRNVNINEDSPDASNLSINSNSPLSELSSILTTQSDSSACYSNEISLPNSLIILFCVLFDLKSNLILNHHFKMISDDYEYFIHFVKEKILLDNEFGPMLRIGMFIKCLRVLLETKPTKDDLIDKRLSDLMRSEFALFKMNNTNDTTSLALMFTQFNHILFKHLNDIEIQNYVIKRCF